MDKKTKIAQINKVIEEYFENNQKVDKIPAMDLMPEFVKTGIFKKDYEREGLPIRILLRELDRTGRLGEIPSLYPERKITNTYWYFQRIKK